VTRVRVLLLSTYELGHQPLHLASPAGELRRAGHEVRCRDLAVDRLDEDEVRWAELVAVSVPMHTAMRLARPVAATVREVNAGATLCFYGLYAGTDDGAGPGRPDVCIAGEYEAELVAVADRLGRGAAEQGQGVRVRLGRQRFGLPARDLLAPLGRYARLLVDGTSRTAGYVEASHGCVHRCRHCPVPVVYDGRTRVVAVDAVLADVAQLVALGAEHITYGDPDFLCGPAHARRVVQAVHGAFPHLTFDVTAKVSHILTHGGLWPAFARAGCLFVVSAFESASDTVLGHLAKGHTVADELEAVAVLRASGIEPRPSLLPFTPWTTAEDIGALVQLIERADLVGNVDPVHYSIRLLVPPGSLLLDGGSLRGRLGPYDPRQLGWTWRSPDRRLDDLQLRLAALAERAGAEEMGARAVHEAVRRTVEEALGPLPPVVREARLRSGRAPDDRPRLSEAWFCCAEPTEAQMAGAASASRSSALPIGAAALATGGLPVSTGGR
jgi:radical SAM superfamily enzyme YgiQ (UPF0313 family)